MKIPFNKPYLTGKEQTYLSQAMNSGHLEGDGPFTLLCQDWLEKQTGSPLALLTHSCTAALEMAALLLEIGPGDEVIMPSYTFVSTASAFALRGGVPVFIDIRPDTLNLDESLIEAAITPRTKAIAVVHYAGVSPDMELITALAKKHNLSVVEDAAQGLKASYKGRALGTWGALGTISFHGTKNIISGEGGALLVNDPRLSHSAEIIREKGTNRKQFLKGEVDKYTWQAIGSSFLPSELTAAFLLAQLENSEEITQTRLDIWNHYHRSLESVAKKFNFIRPTLPEGTSHNAHMYYLLLPPKTNRSALLEHMKERGVYSVSHYVPLHLSPAGKAHCKTPFPLPLTEDLSARLIRLPLWAGMTPAQVELVAGALEESLNDLNRLA